MPNDEPHRPLTPPDDWDKLEPLLDAVLERPPHERASFLAAAYRDDAEMHARLRELLEECEQPDALLDGDASRRFAALLAADDVHPLELPPVIGERFRIIRELGEGGMAVVFLAFDIKHQREVAVKVMRPALAALGAERFLAEIRLTAALRHAHIVPLYDSGEVAGHVFFVMPYVDGESLGARLDRVGALSPAETVAIGRDIAAALEYAHAHGVVHRDVKPSNLLLADGQALLADFGIARAMTMSDADAGFTEPGVVVGTPAYMSPEQASGARHIDARSDLYSLGCVLYEMLAGSPPPAPPLRQALALHGVDPVRSLGELGRPIPIALADCVARAMALEPANRFANAGELAQALVESMGSNTHSPAAKKSLRVRWAGLPRTSRMLTAVASVAVVAIGAAVATVVMRQRAIDSDTMAPSAVPSVAVSGADTSRYVIFPFEHDVTAGKIRLDENDRLRDAMRRWTGISVVDGRDVMEALAGLATPLRSADARTASLRLGAGRYVRGDVSIRDGATRVRAALYDAQSGRALLDSSVSVSTDARQLSSTFESLANYLVLPGVPTALTTSDFVATRSRPALQAFAAGRASIQQWDLERADAQLAAASDIDHESAAAQLWLAQVRVWRGASPPTWSFLANAASTRAEQLSPRDRRAGAALVAYASGDSARACNLWAQLTVREPRDFAAWYGSALCQMRDHAIVRDRSSPSSWRFRTSMHHATASFKRAFEILPAVHREFRESWYWSLSGLLSTKPALIRMGRALPPDTGLFAAYASWSFAGDSLTFTPYRVSDFQEGRASTLPASNGEAVRRQRQVFRDIATTWRAAYPQSSDAMLALSMALDALGDRSAIDSVRIARALATDDDARIRAAAAEVWLRIKLSVPSDVRGLISARILADSILDSRPAATRPDEASALAALAVLTGRVADAALLARLAVDRTDLAVPSAVKSPANALQAFSAAGGPLDSIQVLEREVASAIDATVPVNERAGVKQRWPGRAIMLGFPSTRSALVRDLASTGDVLAVAQAAWLDGDTSTVRRQLEILRIGRAAEAPERLMLEALYPEAWLLNEMGDVRGAITWLGPTLDAQIGVSPETLANPVGAGALLRAMAFRAELASRIGDHASSVRWANAVATLWSHPDPFLRALNRRMNDLARRQDR